MGVFQRNCELTGDTTALQPWQNIGYTLLFCVILTVVLGLIQEAMKRVPELDVAVYSTRLHRIYEERRIKGHKLTPPKRGKGPLGWLFATLRVPDDGDDPSCPPENNKLFQAVGLDAYCFLRFLKMATRQAGFTALLGALFLLPVYRQHGSEMEDHQFLSWTMANLRGATVSADGHWYDAHADQVLWLPAVLSGLYCIHAVNQIHKEFLLFSKLQRYFQLHGDASASKQAVYSIMVEGLPPHLRCNAALRAYFNRISEGHVSSVNICLHTTRIRRMWMTSSKLAGKIEEALAAREDTGTAPTLIPLKTTPIEEAALRSEYHWYGFLYLTWARICRHFVRAVLAAQWCCCGCTQAQSDTNSICGLRPVATAHWYRTVLDCLNVMRIMDVRKAQTIAEVGNQVASPQMTHGLASPAAKARQALEASKPGRQRRDEDAEEMAYVEDRESGCVQGLIENAEYRVRKFHRHTSRGLLHLSGTRPIEQNIAEYDRIHHALQHKNDARDDVEVEMSPIQKRPSQEGLNGRDLLDADALGENISTLESGNSLTATACAAFVRELLDAALYTLEGLLRMLRVSARIIAHCNPSSGHRGVRPSTTAFVTFTTLNAKLKCQQMLLDGQVRSRRLDAARRASPGDKSLRDLERKSSSAPDFEALQLSPFHTEDTTDAASAAAQPSISDSAEPAFDPFEEGSDEAKGSGGESDESISTAPVAPPEPGTPTLVAGVAASGFVGGHDAGGPQAEPLHAAHDYFPRLIVRNAPEPRDVIWRNVCVDIEASRMREFLADGFFTFGALFISVPMAAFANAGAVLEALKIHPNCDTEFSAFFYVLLFENLPSLLFLLVLALSPYLCEFSASHFERYKSVVAIQKRVFVRYFFLQLAYIYVSVISGAVVSVVVELVSSPAHIIRILGESLPTASIFSLKLLLFNMLVMPAVEVSRFLGLLEYGIVRLFYSVRTGKRVLKRWSGRPNYLYYGFAFASVFISMIIVFAFQVISPLLSVAGFFTFLSTYLVYKHQVLYTYVPVSEGGGTFFWDALKFTLATLVAGQIALVTYFCIKLAYGQAIFSCLFPIVTMYYAYRMRTEFAVATALPYLGADPADDASEIDVSKFSETTYRQEHLREDVPILPKSVESPAPLDALL